MARKYRKHAGGKKRGLKKGHKKSAAWRAAISRGMKKAWRSGKMKHRRKGKHRKHSTRKRRTTRKSTTRRKKSGTRKKRVRYLTHDAKTGRPYF